MIIERAEGTAPKHELAPELNGARELYWKHQESGLYDKESGLWQGAHNEQGRIITSVRHTEAQLWGVTTKALLFGKEAAKADYLALTDRPAMYDKKAGMWLPGENVDGSQMGSVFETDTQWIDVLAKGFLFGSEAAKSQIERLEHKKMLREPSTGFWYRSIDQNGSRIDTRLLTKTQLTAQLAVGLFSDIEKARSMRDSLMEAPVYDREGDEFHLGMYNGATLGKDSRVTTAQLSSVTAESLFRPKLAAAKLEALKGTPLYDDAAGQWRLSMSSDNVVQNSNRYAGAQLEGVFAEIATSKKGGLPSLIK